MKILNVIFLFMIFSSGSAQAAAGKFRKLCFPNGGGHQVNTNFIVGYTASGEAKYLEPSSTLAYEPTAPTSPRLEVLMQLNNIQQGSYQYCVVAEPATKTYQIPKYGYPGVLLTVDVLQVLHVYRKGANGQMETTTQVDRADQSSY